MTDEQTLAFVRYSYNHLNAGIALQEFKMNNNISAPVTVESIEALLNDCMEVTIDGEWFNVEKFKKELKKIK